MSLENERRLEIECTAADFDRVTEESAERVVLLEFTMSALEAVLSKARPLHDPNLVRLGDIIDATGVANRKELFAKISDATDLFQVMSASQRNIAEDAAATRDRVLAN